MNVSDIILRVQRQFGDEASVQITEDDVLRWINDGQKEIALQNELSQAEGTLNAVVGLNSYPFPPDMLGVHTIYFKNNRIKYLSRTTYDEYINVNDPDEIATGDPVYYTRWANNFTLYPRPSSVGIIKLLYTARPADVNLVPGILAIPIEYHVRLVEYCLQKAYETDEDWDAAAAKATQFDAGLSILKENAQNPDKEYYPTVTVLPDDQF